VFVYGTLREGDDNDITRLEPAPQFVGRAQIRGVLHHLGRYPGVILGGETWVQGEVYAISAALELKLDEIESLYPEKTDEYFKRELNVSVPTDGQLQSLRCIVYEINPMYAQGKPLIASGDWRQGRRAPQG
jgi:gamma-glutamylcyclotransferase (GGCT)/AIG2-like uncharacterized protein YtfP